MSDFALIHESPFPPKPFGQFFYKLWRGRWGLNPQPSKRQSDALAKLSYVPIENYGGDRKN